MGQGFTTPSLHMKPFWESHYFHSSYPWKRFVKQFETTSFFRTVLIATCPKINKDL